MISARTRKLYPDPPTDDYTGLALMVKAGFVHVDTAVKKQ